MGTDACSRDSTRLSSHIQGTAPSPDDLGRRTAAVLPGDAHGSRDLQPVLLVPGWSADVPFALRRLRGGQPTKTRTCSASCCHRPGHDGVSIRPNTTLSTWRSNHDSHRQAASRSQRSWCDQFPDHVCGDFSTTGSSSRKAARVGVVLRMNGPDPEGLTHEQRHRVTHQLEATLRAFDENVRVYQYLIKQRVGPFVAPKAGAVVANESFARRAAYLNERRRQLFHLDQYLVCCSSRLNSARSAGRCKSSGGTRCRRLGNGCRFDTASR